MWCCSLPSTCWRCTLARKPGLATAHDKARARLLREFQEGALCPYCARPMSRRSGAEPLDADHYPARAVAGPFGGVLRLSHRRCNRRAGGQLRARLAAARKAAAGGVRQPRPFKVTPQQSDRARRAQDERWRKAIAAGFTNRW